MTDNENKKIESLVIELEKRKSNHKDGSGRNLKRLLRKIIRKTLMLLAVAFLVLAGVFILNFFRLNSDLIDGHIKEGLVPSLTNGQFELEFGGISGNLLKGVELDSVVIKNKYIDSAATLLTVPRIALEYSLLDVLLGNLVLENIIIENPVLTLNRDEKGRALWDFSIPREQAILVSKEKKQEKPTKRRSKWDREQHRQKMEARYLSSINIVNLTVLVPNPQKLITDPFISRIITLPNKTKQITGVNLSLKKYPAENYNAHVFKIFTREEPSLLTFQITTMKETGDFSIVFDALGQNLNVGVTNIGQKGRAVTFYDARNRDRLNLNFLLDRNGNSLFNKVKELNGVVNIDSLESIKSDLLAKDSRIGGALKLIFNSEENQALYDAKTNISLKDFQFHLAGLPAIEDFNIDIAIENRTASLKKIEGKIEKVDSKHSGTLIFKDEGELFLSIDSDISGEKASTKAEYIKIEPGVDKFVGLLTRNSGKANVTFNRKVAGKKIEYTDFNFSAEIVDSGSAEDILPFNILPKNIAGQLNEYCKRVQILGPFKVNTAFKTIKDWRKSKLVVDLDGTTIVNKVYPSDFIKLAGKALIEEGDIRLEGIKALIDNLDIKIDGYAKFQRESQRIDDYNINIEGFLKDNKDFKISSERLKAILGLSAEPDFDSVDIKGNKILSLNTKMGNNVQFFAGFDKLRFVRRKKALWMDNTVLNVVTDPISQENKFIPKKINTDFRTEFFGLPIEANCIIDTSNKIIDDFSLKGGGSNFAMLLEAIKTQPEGRDFLKKYPLQIVGAFSFALLGSGEIKKPNAEGWIRFPELKIKMQDFMANLPFYAQIKTQPEGYLASFKSGDASVKVKDVSFELGKALADMRYFNLTSPAGADVEVNLSADVFGVDIMTKGVIAKAGRHIDTLTLNLKSEKIDKLAREISKIGKFDIPFNLSGRFDARADVSGSIKEPSAKGFVQVGSINLDFPIKDSRRKTILKAESFSGKVEFNKLKNTLFSLNLANLTGKILGATIKGKGKAALKDLEKGLKPVIENLDLEISDLQMTAVSNFLKTGLLPEEVEKAFIVENGIVNGSFNVSGTPKKITAKGKANLDEGAIKFAAMKDAIKNLKVGLIFEGRTDSNYAKIGLKNVRAELGRSVFEVSEGWLEDPIRTGKLFLAGTFDKLYPADFLTLFGGMRIPAVTFPEEGYLNGKIDVTGDLADPLIETKVNSTAMKVAYDTGTQKIEIPFGNNKIDLKLKPASGEAILEQFNFGLLGGTIITESGTGAFTPDKPFVINVLGKLNNIDFSKLKLNEKEVAFGFLDGNFNVDWTDKGSRDAVFNLNFRNIFIPELPFVDASMKKTTGEMLTPDIRTGQINFYLSTEEEEEFKGKLLVADGLFAGPHLRLELDNSEFEPEQMSLRGQLMINPQSLRNSEIGKKLGKLSSVMQDRNTGIPYVDLTVSGNWANPSLIADTVKKRASKRVAKNFVYRIFGRHRPHKASVQELMEWFPGWEKGK